MSAGARPYCFRIGSCSGAGRSTPLKPIRARILHRSSKGSVDDVPHTEAMTLCLMGARRAGACPCAAAALWLRGAAKGTAAMPARNSLLFMAALYFAADDLSAKVRRIMTRRHFMIGVLAVVIAVSGQLPAAVGQELRDGSYRPPRTPWGDPDLQGTFTNKY